MFLDSTCRWRVGSKLEPLGDIVELTFKHNRHHRVFKEDKQSCPRFPSSNADRGAPSEKESHADPMNFANQNQLFEISTTLFPPSSAPKSLIEHVFSSGKHSFPFAVSFPTNATCFLKYPHARKDCALPPSMSFKASGWTTQIIYRLEVRLKLGRSLLNRELETEKRLTFIPTNHYLPPPPSPPPSSSLKVIIAPLPAALLGIHPDSNPSYRSSLPAYSPKMSLEGSLDTSISLSPGTPLPLRLWLLIPASVSKAINLHLRRLTVSICSRTVLHLQESYNPHHHQKTCLTELPIYQKKDLDMLLHVDSAAAAAAEGDVLDLDGQLLKECVLPKMLPSFKGCKVEREHLLRVAAEFSSNASLLRHTVAIFTEITVTHDCRPPSYEKLFGSGR